MEESAKYVSSLARLEHLHMFGCIQIKRIVSASLFAKQAWVLDVVLHFQYCSAYVLPEHMR